MYQNNDYESISSRLNQYPHTQKKIPREIHGPCGGHKFNGVFSRNNVNYNNVCENEEFYDDKVGNELFLKYKRAGIIAVKSFRYINKNKKDVEKEIDSDGFVAKRHENGEMGLENDDFLVSSVQNRLARVHLDDHVKKTDEKVGTVWLQLLSNEVDYFKAEKKVGSSSLKFLAFLCQKISNAQLLKLAYQIHHRFLGVLEDLLQNAFAPLTYEEKNEVYQALLPRNRKTVLVTHQSSNIEITGEVLNCLKLGQWLNDEVINVYMELLKEREKREPEKFLKCHFFNTFFYKKLIGGKSGYDYKSVRRWTTQKKLGYNLFECHKIFVPIHKEGHWCLAVINNKDKKFHYIDSLRGIDAKVLRILAMYYVDEVNDKSGVDIDVDSWIQEHDSNIPVQKNGWDCGMFMIKYVDFYSMGLELFFQPGKQRLALDEDMPYFRFRTTKEILRLKAQ